MRPLSFPTQSVLRENPSGRREDFLGRPSLSLQSRHQRLWNLSKSDYPTSGQNLVGRSEVRKKNEIINNELLTKQRPEPISVLPRTCVAAERGASTPYPA